MSDQDDLKTIVVRLEGKVDTLAVQVASGDKHGEQLVEIVRQQLGSLQQSMLDLRSQLLQTAQRASTEVSAVRVDLERQLGGHVQTGDKVVERVERAIDELWRASAAHATSIARLYGGLAVCAVLGAAGFAAAYLRLFAGG